VGGVYQSACVNSGAGPETSGRVGEPSPPAVGPARGDVLAAPV